MLKNIYYYLLLFIIVFSIFGCKNVKSYVGVLKDKYSLPFTPYGIELSIIYLETSDEYINIVPEEKYYQDFINNFGGKVIVTGEEVYDDFQVDRLTIISPDERLTKDIHYKLKNAKIKKVLK